ncbi:MAG: type II toxin-antitoxin system RelE/ParE family toxin [Coriobacteriia bacterium]|nr:type II toxin-antitoxin system RelE/ParE family toxin [Coriobacteriia bacterium]
MRVIWAPLAREQVADAFAFISAERPAAALNWFDAIVDQTGSLSTFPDMGRMMPEAGRSEVREVIVEPYRLIYRRDPDMIVIIGVFHFRQEVNEDGLSG